MTITRPDAYDTINPAMGWGTHPNGAPFLYFNPAAWASISSVAADAEIDPQNLILMFFTRPILAVYEVTTCPKFVLSWCHFDDKTAWAVTFRDDIFPVYCRCLNLTIEEGQAHFLDAIVANLWACSDELEPQGNA